MRSAVLFVMAATTGAAVRAQEVPPTEPEEQESLATAADVAPVGPQPDWLRGQLSFRYWGRWSDGQSDQKLYATLSVDVGDPEHHAVSGRFMGRAVWNAHHEDELFAGITDTWEDDLTAYLYDAYMDVNCISGVNRVRLGRQTIWDTPVVLFFDGGSIESDPIGDLKLRLGAYGGASARLYESADGDWLAGAYVEGRPWSGGRLRFDYTHLEDDITLGSVDGDLLGIGYWQNFARSWLFDVGYTMLDSESRDLRGRLAFTDPASTLMLQVSYYQLFQKQGLLPLEIDPFTELLGALFPYYQVGVLGSKGLGEHFDVQAGVDLRRVDDSQDIGAYNRDYERYFGNLGMHGLILDGFSVRLFMDLWYSDGNDVQTGGIDLSQQLCESLVASVGSYYSLYKYDFFTNSERDNVRTYYITLKHATTKNLDLELNYEYENTDIGDFNGLRLGGVWRF